MDLTKLDRSGCPWLRNFSRAAYACEGVLRLLNAYEPFACRRTRDWFLRRGGFCVAEPPQRREAGPGEEDRFLGAVLAKLAHREVPAPCSVGLERHLLAVAEEAGLLHSEEAPGPAIEFHVTPCRPSLQPMLLACLLPELLLDEPTVEALLGRYQDLCTVAEREVFQGLLRPLPQRRLGLLWTVQRRLRTALSQAAAGSEADRVDFALELPDLGGTGWRRWVIELDDPTHQGAQRRKDQERDRLLRQGGWEVIRLSFQHPSAWHDSFERLAGVIAQAVPLHVLHAAGELRNLPAAQRRAVQNLVLLPAAEAQLQAAIGRLLQADPIERVRVVDSLGHGLDPVLHSLQATLDALCRIHGLGHRIEVEPAAPGAEADIVYFGLPDPRAWDAIQARRSLVLCPCPVPPWYEEPLVGVAPRPVQAGARQQELRAGLEHVLQNVFRKKAFRPGQMEIIERALALKPVIGLLPTGAGKSLCYQLASLTQPGATLVVDPLRSLLLDQDEHLNALGIHRSVSIMSRREGTPIHDQARREEVYEGIAEGRYLFILITPERLQMPVFRKPLASFARRIPLGYCVVDEAHCVSEWGHDFRPSYLNIGRTLRVYCCFRGVPPCLLALTGTASRNVLLDIMRELQIDDHDAIVEPHSFDREELSFRVVRVRAVEREKELGRVLDEVLREHGWNPSQPARPPSGLIFTNFATPSYIGVGALAAAIARDPGLNVEVYSGTTPDPGVSSDTWERQRDDIQRRFKRNESPILVCTHGFGMGIDKSDIRFTIHAMLPRSLEDFYQQAGRAGRDQVPATCVVLFTDDQPFLADQILDTERTPLEEIEKNARSLSQKGKGDALRNLWFLTHSFRGVDAEKAILRSVVYDLLAPLLRACPDGAGLEVCFDALKPALLLRERDPDPNLDERTLALEKALHRLLQVGALADYGKDYQRRCFEIDIAHPGDVAAVYESYRAYLRCCVLEYEIPRYLSRQEVGNWADAAVACGEKLVEYIYATVAKRRRRALGQMLQAARDAARLPLPEHRQSAFRQQLLAYLEVSEFTEPVKSLVGSLKPDAWFGLLDRVEGMDGVVKLLGACRRRLEEVPDHPGLLLLAGLCRTASANPEQGPLDVRSAFLVLARTFRDPAERVQVAQRALEQVRRLTPSQADAMLGAALEGDASREMARFCYAEAQEDGPNFGMALGLLCRGLAVCLRSGR
jgi:RecQ family ATP-dependent DNA helicase